MSFPPEDELLFSRIRPADTPFLNSPPSDPTALAHLLSPANVTSNQSIATALRYSRKRRNRTMTAAKITDRNFAGPYKYVC